MTCSNCGAILRVKNRSKSEPDNLCAPCVSSSWECEPYECPLCGGDACNCFDRGMEENEDATLEASAILVAGADFARGCQCEDPIVIEDDDGRRCLCGSWV